MNKKIPMSKRDSEVVRLFSNGVPCSRIDQAMSLVEGTAHDVIVMTWAKDKAMAIEEKRAKLINKMI